MKHLLGIRDLSREDFDLLLNNSEQFIEVSTRDS